MKIIRKILGAIILFFDALIRPKKMKRTEDDQKKVDIQTKNMSLYQFHACPFCVKVRRAIYRLSINVELRDAQNDETYRQELLKEGGRIKVPCLRIQKDNEVQWMYESNDIITYLNGAFGKA